MVLGPNGLLEAKLIRLIKGDDEASAAFVTTLLTCGGVASKTSGALWGYSGYRASWGESTFGDVKQRLLEEGIIQETEESLALNLTGFKDLSKEAQEELIRELSALLFQEGWRFYGQVLQQVLSDAEGQYILGEFARVGPSLSDYDINHVMAATGSTYYSRVTEMLTRAGLFIYHFSSKRHDYYRIFPPLISAMRLDSPAYLEALVFVYIAQGVRREGVLAEECEAPAATMELLRDLGFIEEKAWYRFLCLTTTERGVEKAAEYAQKRLEEAKPSLEELLQEIPYRLLQFLWTDVVEPEWPDEGRYCVAPQVRHDLLPWGIGDVGIREERFLCILNNDRVRRLRDRLLGALVEKKLAVKTHSYVATRGGELREQVYVLSPEAKKFIHGFLQERGLMPSGALFPEQHAVRHRLYHLFSLYSSEGGGPKEGYFSMGERYGLEREHIQSAFRTLVEKNAVKDEGDEWTITDVRAYWKAVEEEFFSPLVDYVLAEEPMPPPSVPTPPEPKPPLPLARLQVVLGRTEKDEDYCWEPLNEPNPHLLIVGSPGVGKTQTAKSIICQLRGKVPAFIVDFGNEYGESDLVGLVLAPGQEVTINPLDPLEGDPTNAKFTVSGILRKVYKLGDQQEALLRRAIEEAYKKAGILGGERFAVGSSLPHFNTIRGFLEEAAGSRGSDRNRAKAVLNRLEPVFDMKVFSGKTEVPFAEVLRQGATLFLKELPTEQTKLAVAEFFLRWLWHRIVQEKEVRGSLRLIVVLDEAHKLAYEDSPVADLLRQGRKFGVSVILSTQQPNDFEHKELAFQNTSCHVAFLCASDRHAETMAKIVATGRDVERFHHEIKRLKQFEALAASSTKEATKITVIPYYKLGRRSANQRQSDL